MYTTLTFVLKGAKEGSAWPPLSWKGTTKDDFTNMLRRENSLNFTPFSAVY